jgi:1-acylglycerone phosphate reductase
MHKVDLTKDELEMCLKWFFIAQTPYKVVVCLNKVSVILLYLRIFVTKYFRIAAFVVLFIVVGYGIGGIGATIWQCVPIEGAWLQLPGKKCIDSGMFWVAYAVLNIVTDVMVLGLPILPIVQLQLRWRDRLLLCGVFTLGGL